MLLIRLKKALLVSAFFCATSLAAEPLCPPAHIDETARVSYVYDGDTVKLVDGRKVRFIGINTPEIGHKGKSNEAYAAEARNFLTSQLKAADMQVSLQFGPQRADHYQRSLAHLFLADGTNLQASLVAEGLATAFVTPPNDRFSACYAAVEKTAREAGRGLWSHQKYHLKTVFELTAKSEGFHRLHGRITKIEGRGGNLWLELDKRVRIKIKKADLANFDLHQLRQMEGRSVKLRGWLHPRKYGWYMTLRHPSAIALYDIRNAQTSR